MDFDIPADLASYLSELDEFIEREIRPLEQQDDNARFFDYRREDARTDWDRGGLPDRQWDELRWWEILGTLRCCCSRAVINRLERSRANPAEFAWRFISSSKIAGATSR